MKLPFSRFLTAAITAVGMVAPAPAQPVSQNMELMGAIAREIVNSGEPQGVDWVEVSAIFSIDADGDVNGSYGYVYDARGQAHAAAFLEDPIEREVKAYRDWLLLKGRKGDKGIIKMLFQFNRQTRRVRADFEYEDPRRWQVTPANLDARVKELQPHLGAADGR